MPLLDIRGLKTHFKTEDGWLHAVDGVDMALDAGETLCVVGESGCGKSVTAKTVMKLIDMPPGKIVAGQVMWQGRDLVPLPLAEMQKIRAKEIAIALACKPKLLIADEPTTALDVTIQAQILDLLAELKSELGMAVMLITHAMGVVAEVAQRVVVMYAGKVVEEAPVEELFARPRHPYTQGLIRSIPRIDMAATHKVRLEAIAGTVPKLVASESGGLPPGCRFAPRCRFAMPACTAETPPLRDIGNGHKVACILEVAPS